MAHRSGTIEKRGPGALKQGKWIRAADLSVLPTVVKLLPDGYVMEELAHPAEPVSFADVRNALAQIWLKPPLVKPDLAATIEKVEGLCDKFGHLLSPHRRRTIAKLATLSCDKPQLCLTHGDPTLENVMLRGTDIVLCDPIPATKAVPDIRAVDLGKLLQSAVGWESHIRRRTAARWWIADILLLGPPEQTVAWCVIHLLRALPYLAKNQHDALMWLLNGALTIL